MRGFYIIGGLWLLLSCSQKTVSSSSSSLTCTANESETHELCINVAEDSKNPTNISKAYYLVDESGDRILEGVLDGGYVQWLNDTAIEIFQPPGMMPTEISKDEIIKVFDLSTGEMTTKAAYLSTIR